MNQQGSTTPQRQHRPGTEPKPQQAEGTEPRQSKEEPDRPRQATQDYSIQRLLVQDEEARPHATMALTQARRKLTGVHDIAETTDNEPSQNEASQRWQAEGSEPRQPQEERNPIELYTEVGKARKYYNTPASNSRRNTDRHEALPVRYRMLFALSEPKASSALGGERKMKWT